MKPSVKAEMMYSKEAITLGHILLRDANQIKHRCSPTGFRALAGMLSVIPGAGASWCHPLCSIAVAPTMLKADYLPFCA